MPIKTNQFIAIILRKSFNFLEDKEQLKKDKENNAIISKCSAKNQTDITSMTLKDDVIIVKYGTKSNKVKFTEEFSKELYSLFNETYNSL